MTAIVPLVIVGGGLAGLSAAHYARRAGVDHLIIESRCRLGGRLQSHIYSDGHRVELGARYTAGFHEEVLRLAKSLGVGLVNSATEADEQVPSIVELHGTALSARQRRRLLNDIEAAIATCVDRASATIPDDLSQLDVEAWLQEQGIGPNAVRLFTDLPRHAQSAWALLHLVRAAGGHPFFGASEAYEFEAGSDAFVAALAGSVESGRILVNHRVVDISRRGVGYEVDVVVAERSTRTIRCDAVVIAATPAIAGQILGDFSLPSFGGMLTANRQIGAVVNLPAPMRQSGLIALSDGPVRTARLRRLSESSPMAELEIAVRSDFDPRHEDMATLVSIAMRLLRQSDDWRASPVETEWHNMDEFQGSYGAIPPGRLMDLTVDTIAVDERLFIASDMASTGFAGYMEGSLRSARNAVDQIIQGGLG